jgi:aminoglycoside N3'-acetyltransferase
LTEAEARTALEGILTALGVKAGDRIMLGIDMGNVPLPTYEAALTRAAFRERERRWCAFVLDVLLSRLGHAGTLLVPSFTYSCGKPGSSFIVESTPSENGPFPEFFRVQPGVTRSIHPIFSLAGVGRDVNALLAGVGRSAFGTNSPFGRFAAHGVRFLCLGVELRNSVTYVHHLEQSYGCPHRYHKTFDTSVTSNGTVTPGPWLAYVAFRGLDYGSDITSLQRALKDRGDLVEAVWNGHPNHLADIDAVNGAGYELLARDSGAFVNRRLRFTFDDSSVPANDDVATVIVTATDESGR